MKRAAALSVMLLTVVLAACSTEWRTTEGVTPTTYTAPVVRAPTSVGRLGRLAVMQVELHREADAGEKSQPGWQSRSDQLKRELQAAVTRFLAEQKGYDARAVDDAIPSGEAAVRESGRRLGVDGLVTVQRWITKPWTTGQAIGNIFMLNIPLFNALNAVNLRIAIHETASGRLVWQKEMKGEDPDSTVRQADIAGALGGLDNAVPAQLRR